MDYAGNMMQTLIVLGDKTVEAQLLSDRAEGLTQLVEEHTQTIENLQAVVVAKDEQIAILSAELEKEQARANRREKRGST